MKRGPRGNLLPLKKRKSRLWLEARKINGGHRVRSADKRKVLTSWVMNAMDPLQGTKMPKDPSMARVIVMGKQAEHEAMRKSLQLFLKHHVGTVLDDARKDEIHHDMVKFLQSPRVKLGLGMRGKRLHEVSIISSPHTERNVFKEKWDESTRV